MLGRLFCILWAHHWVFMFSNGRSRAVLHCTRCMAVKVDNS
jgi:hypothetical protein